MEQIKNIGKRVCIVSLGNLYLTPYLRNYVDELNKNGIDFDIIYWDRHQAKDIPKMKGEVFIFDLPMKENKKKIVKVVHFLKFKKFVKEKLAKNNYSGIIFLNTIIAIMMINYLFYKKKQKYIVDIRDFTLENNKLFYFLEKIVLKNSAMNVISSSGFKKFLPPTNYTVIHNTPLITQEEKREYTKKGINKNLPIKISFIGLVRFDKQDKKLVTLLANDERFQILYAGTGSERLKEFCEKHNIKNVEFINRFDPRKTLELYGRTDIINNFYGNESLDLHYALSNKLYYAASLNIPILVSSKTYMSEITTSEYNLGLIIEEAENLGDRIINWYQNIIYKELEKDCKKFIKKAELENSIFNSRLNNILKSW